MTQRQTRQRDAILRVLEGAPGPLSVPELLERAQEELPALGIATVYRTLKLLQEDGRVRALSLDGESRFERADLGHHHHFACRKCGGVFDLALCPVSLPSGTVYPGGFVVEAHEVTLYGLCPRCAA
ncbi:Fur family transcriptional regulator [Deinococcus peraridilitoris]|uniref:Fe2+/Zn2+ uptake regulation protein n=1 Tax=Deinococcus peraridilitoris (strain DSM 19664 / LMG 22246 / CIP 109416 / KR-200) TaxID=937777 RepID=L0A403_DEIPD|nr:transcriptional repressor [Deinococcus peraridilitoris]AFZ68581.1 Fe2+/Zn2+ uptake regulation protein [Deinococcus peraridilitoris DSM 19664]